MHKITLKTTLSTGLLPKAQKAVAKGQLNRFLNEMPEGTTAYVAGGAPRDWHHGWGCRDIDIFYNVPDDQSDVVAKTLEKYELIRNDYGYYSNSQGILSVHEYEVGDYSKAKSGQSRKVQLVRVEGNPMEVIRDFPISLSRIWMDKEGDIFCDDAYQIGYNARVIHEMHNKQWNYMYLDKILGRFDQYVFMPCGWGGRRPEQEQI